ncbi:MAG: trypsin-like peptidase domain-containing protein [Phycisphaerae bacterium]|nr:trypsin-like peptidase domain-containing protein [Phycisphaerae bacterium]
MRDERLIRGRRTGGRWRDSSQIGHRCERLTPVGLLGTTPLSVQTATAVLAVLGLVLPAIQAQAQPAAADPVQVEALEQTLVAVAETLRPSVVAIRANRPMDGSETQEAPEPPPNGGVRPGSSRRGRPEERRYPSVGSGVIISPDGQILTNEHVVAGAQPDDITCILSSGESYRVQEVYADPRSDLAVMTIGAKGLKPAVLGNLETVRQGQFAIVMGNPFGSALESRGRPAMSFGVISALGRGLNQQLDPLMTQRYYGNLIQTDARINPGNSGGPLLNLKGEVIGINTAISSRSGGSEGMGYAIPMSARTKEIIAALARGEEVEYGFLGVGLRSIRDEEPQGSDGPTGAVVDSIERQAPAAAADLKVGDIIVTVDGHAVRDADEAIALIGGARVGVPMQLIFRRGSRRLTAQVVPARRKVASPAAFSWRGMRLAYPDWEVCRSYKLPADVRGAVITEVEPGGPAARAGLHVGQVIDRIGEARIQGVRYLPTITAKLSGPVKIALVGDPPTEVTLP